MTPTQQSLIERAERRLSVATSQLLFRFPFFSVAIYRARRTPDFSCETFWTDGRTIGYNPNFVLDEPFEIVVLAEAHESTHIYSKHNLRRDGREMELWQIATDRVTNAVLVGAGFKLPDWAIQPEPGDSAKTPETIYDELVAERAAQREADRDEERQRQQDEEDFADDPGESEQQGGSKSSQQGEQSKSKSSAKSKSASASSDDESSDAEQGESDDEQGAQQSASQTPKRKSLGEVRDLTNEDGSEMSDSEKALAEAEQDVVTQQAVRAATKAGNLPGSLAHFAAAVTSRHVPWQEVLARFLDERAPTDYSWTRPNLAYQSATGFFLPSLGVPALGAIVIGADTSGSMQSAHQLDDVVAEVQTLVAMYQEQGVVPSVSVLWCDTVVHAQLLGENDDKPAPVGLGGTSFAPVFEYVDREQMMPRAIVYLTDGECDDFGREPDCPVLWLLTKFNDRFQPPFGEVCFMPERRV